MDKTQKQLPENSAKWKKKQIHSERAWVSCFLFSFLLGLYAKDGPQQNSVVTLFLLAEELGIGAPVCLRWWKKFPYFPSFFSWFCFEGGHSWSWVKAQTTKMEGKPCLSGGRNQEERSCWSAGWGDLREKRTREGDPLILIMGSAEVPGSPLSCTGLGKIQNRIAKALDSKLRLKPLSTEVAQHLHSEPT